MTANIEISGHPDGAGLQVRTPGGYAMDLAIDVLAFLDEHDDISVKNTGWKNGFGLEVCAWIPIRYSNLVAELETDGDEFQIRRASGPHSKFETLFEMIREFLNDKTA